MNPVILIAALVCFTIGVPFLTVSVMSLKYREGKPFQAKVHLSGDDQITVRYKIKGKVYFKEFPWQPINPLARKPKPGQNVTLKGTPENPTQMVFSRGGLESSFALKIVGLIIGGLFSLVGLFLLLLALIPLVGAFLSRNNEPDFFDSYYSGYFFGSNTALYFKFDLIYFVCR